MNKSTIMLIAAAGAVALLIGAGVVRCTFASHADQEDAPEIVQEEPRPEATNTEAPSANEPEPSEETSSADVSAIEDYLNTNWTAESSELALLDGVFIESNGTDSAPTYFTIEDVAETDDVLTLTVWAAARPGDAGAQSIIVIDHSRNAPTVTSDLFKLSHTYELSPNENGAIAVQGATEDLNSYLEATTSEITSVLSAYADEHLSGASVLSWTGEAYTDYFNETRITTFIADDPAATIVTLIREADGTLGAL